MHRALAASAAALFAAAAATSYRDRLTAIRGDAAVQRDKLGLPLARLYAEYPTPEMTFQGNAPKVACGQTAKLDLTGHFFKGTQLVLHSDDAHLTDVKLTDSKALATLHVSKNALPGPLELEAITPVSGASSSQRVAIVDGKLNISLQFEDGWTAKLMQTREEQYTAAWSKAGKTRTSNAGVHPEEGGLRIELEASPEQQALAQEQVTQVQAQLADPDMQALQNSFAACGKVAKEEQMPCMQKAAVEAQAIGDRLKKKQEAQAAVMKARQPKEAWACSQVSLRGSSGQLTGTATCAATLKVTASVECAPP